MATFADALDVKFGLTFGDLILPIPGANVKDLHVELHPWGFTARAGFWVSSQGQVDLLLEPFLLRDLAVATLTVTSHFQVDGIDGLPLVLMGPVTEKRILEETTISNVPLKDDPVLWRHYEVQFADAAQVLWRQHYPCDLKVDTTLKELLAAHTTGKVKLKYDWDALDTTFAINTLPLTRSVGSPSFYDFVCWLADAGDGVFTYEPVTDTYTLGASKPAGVPAVPVLHGDVARVAVEFPEVPRATVRLLNAYSKDPKREEVDNAQAVTGIQRDVLARYPTPADYTSRKTLEGGRQKLREHELVVGFGRYPAVPFLPNLLFEFKGPGWSDKLFTHDKVYRVRDLTFAAHAVAPEAAADHDMSFSRYHVDLEARFELEDEGFASLPAFRRPVFPILVEGTVVSEQGQEEALTYQIYQDADTSAELYKVTVPLFADQQVVVPLEPNLFPGHFYFPAYKGERVLLALGLHEGAIVRFLDWRAGAKLPLETQGNHLLLGHTDQSQTSIAHTYVDDKPVLAVKRTCAKDTELLQLEEGTMLLQTKEDS